MPFAAKATIAKMKAVALPSALCALPPKMPIVPLVNSAKPDNCAPFLWGNVFTAQIAQPVTSMENASLMTMANAHPPIMCIVAKAKIAKKKASVP
jgi:hypothetical protein